MNEIRFQHFNDNMPRILGKENQEFFTQKL